MEAISFCKALLADPRITMLQMLDMQSPLEVERVYVPLRLAEEGKAGKPGKPGYDAPASDEEATEGTMADDAYVWIEQERQRRERSAEVIYDAERAMQTFQRCVIVGGAGAGKTTLLRYLAIMAAQRSLAGMPAPLPIYIELQSFVRSGLHDLLNFASTAWEGAYAFPAAELRLLLENQLEEGKALLLLDGLEEAVVGETREAAEQSYEAAAQAILAMAAGYPKVSIVATVRKASYRQHKPLVGFTTLEVMDFGFEDVKQFVRSWYDDASAAEKERQFDQSLDMNPHLQVLAANPLLLTLMVLAYEDLLDLPGRRAGLYQICSEAWLAKWDAGGERQREFKAEQKHELLKVIAWHFHRKRQRYFSEHDLLLVIAEYLQASNVPAERKHAMLQAIESEQGVLKEQAAGWHGFVHLSLQEYFAAAYINDHQEYQAYAELLRQRADAWWEEVLLLYMGITADASPFLRQLCSHDNGIREDIFYTNALLAGRCLTVRPTVREAGLRARIMEHLFELLLSTRYSLLRQEAIKVVCSIGVAETNSRLVTLLSDEGLDVSMRWNIADVLGTLGERPLVAELIPGELSLYEGLYLRQGRRSVAGELVRLLADERLHAFVRWGIAEALGRLGERSVAGELVRLLADERLHTELRRGMAEALGRLGERSVAGELVQLLADEQQDMLLRKSIAEALGRLGERSVAGELVQLLADERLNLELRRSIANALGALGERSVATELVQLLADEQQDVDLRRSIADALGTLGEWSVVANAMVQLLADEQQDVFVRRRITGALGTLAEVSGGLTEGSEESERAVAEELVQLLANEWLDAELRMSIADTLGRLADVPGGLKGLERSVVGEMEQLLADEQLDVNVRRAIAMALGKLGKRLVAARAMVQLLADERLDAFTRRSMAGALGRLAEGPGRPGELERPVARAMVHLLADEQLDADLRWSIADALGRLGERSVTGELAQLLADERQDVNVRRSMAIALGKLGERPVAARELVQMLAGDQFGVFAQRSIASVLGTLGERSVAGELARLLADKRLHVFVRRSIAEALGRLAEDSVAGELARLLADERLDMFVRRGIAGALAAYANEVAIVEGLIELLQDEEIADNVYSALWMISKRARVWIFPAHNEIEGQSRGQYEIVRWE